MSNYCSIRNEGDSCWNSDTCEYCAQCQQAEKEDMAYYGGLYVAEKGAGTAQYAEEMVDAGRAHLLAPNERSVAR